MKRCPDCASDVPEEAKVCAHCGHRWLRWWDARAPVGFLARLVVAVVCIYIIATFSATYLV